MTMSSLLRRALLSFSLVALSAPASAADYPTKPVTLVVPFPAGTTTDTSARLVAQHMAKRLGQAVIVDNKPGAGGTIAATFAARAKPDGYTLFWTTSSVQVIAPAVMPNLMYDPIQSFEPIGLAIRIPQVLAVSNSLPAKTFGELVALAKSRPGVLNYATLGPNTTQNLIFSAILQKLGVAMTHVPYTSTAQSYPDLLAGRLDAIIDNLPNVLPFSQRGDLRALAVTTEKRVDVLPDVATISEAAIPNFEMLAWTGLVVPAGTPQEIVKIIRDAYATVIGSEEFRSWAATNAAIPATEREFASFGQFILRELETWKAVAEQSGVAIP